MGHVKRVFDAIVAFCGLVVLSPLLLLLALGVAISSGRPVFYAATRVGRHEKPFSLYKFRTMRPLEEGADRRPITVAGDDRVLPFGRVLRKYKLDELPQLFNVLRGDMSLVGPRPEDPRYVALYSPSQRRLLEFRPGITSSASLMFRREEEMLGAEDWEEAYIGEIMPRKLAIEAEYLNDWSVWKDARVLFDTARVLLFGSGLSESRGSGVSDGPPAQTSSPSRDGRP